MNSLSLPLEQKTPVTSAVTASYAATGALAAVIYGKASGFGGMSLTQNYDNRLDITSISANSTAGTAINLGYCYYDWTNPTCSTTSPNNGNVTAIANNKDTGRTETFSYDYLNRLGSATTQATSGADCWGQSFVIDPVANLTTINSTQTGCAVGTLSASANVATNQLGFTPAPVYDKSGNMTNDGNYGYTFDAENRITSGNSVAYTYDGNGRRVEKSSGTLYWRTAGGDVLTETDASGNTKNEYIYFAGQRVAWWDSLGNSYYIYSDTLRSTRTITESNGTVCYDADLTPYGQELVHTSNCPSSYNYKFTGYERDTETNLDYAFARYYSSRLGRFVSADPLEGGITDPQLHNRYAYVRNNPERFLDPLGLKCVTLDDGSIGDDGEGDGCDTDYSPYIVNVYDILDNSYDVAPVSIPDVLDVSGIAGFSGSPDNPSNNGTPTCLPKSSLNWSQKAQLVAAQFYAGLTGWTFGFGAGLDAGAGIGPKGSSWNFGVGGSASTLIVADGAGNSGFLNSASGGFSAVKMSGAGSWWGAGAAAGPSLLVSPNPISTIAGPSGSFSAGGGAVLGAGISITTSGAATVTFGVGAGAEAGVEIVPGLVESGGSRLRAPYATCSC